MAPKHPVRQGQRGRLAYFTFAFLFALGTFVRYLLSRANDHQTRTFDNDIRDYWIDYIDHFPVQPKDRYAFQEMGFRTHAYAKALAGGGEQLRAAVQLESMLWSFVGLGLKGSALSARNLLSAARTSDDRLARWPFASSKGKQGIVTVTQRETLRATVELVSTLRYSLLDNTPIEIFFFGEEDMPQLIDDAFSMMPGVKTVDLAATPVFHKDAFDGLLLQNMTHKRTSALQALALFMSGFTQTVYAEPGTIFLEKPSLMFQEPGFLATGTLFFHGRNEAQKPDANRFLNFLRQQFDQGQPSVDLASSPFYNFGIDSHQDSRVLAIDRTRPSVFGALLLNVWLQSPPVRDQIWHAHFPQCLSESLWLAFELSKAPYYFEKAYPGAIGVFDGSTDELPWDPMICPAHALHFIGRQSYASRQGRPFWADGGLKLFPHHTDTLRINAWSARGRWEQTQLGMCLIGADARSSDQYALTELFKKHHVIDQTFEEVFSPIFANYNMSML